MNNNKHVAGKAAKSSRTTLATLHKGSIRLMRMVIVSLFVITGMSAKAQVAASVVSAEEAETVAKQLLSKDVVRVDVTNVASLRRKAQAHSKSPAYYIYNSNDGRGFVIVSGEKGTEQVLAYSAEGAFDVSKVGFGADAFLNAYDECIANIRSGEATANAAKPRRISATPKLLKTVNWDQSGVWFNSKYAPTVNSRTCLAGCGPTAMAIVMRYWEHPKQGRGSFSYTTATYKKTLSCDFSKETFDWSLMADKPAAGSKESDAVSRLIRDCGIAMWADYGPNVTFGYLCGLMQGMKDYFDYKGAKYIMRDMYNIDDWEEVILNEIDNDRPCIVAAQGTYDRHIFVVDGVSANGMFHYNLGWGGYNNGYYIDGSIAGTECNYATDELIYGIEPAEEYQPTSQLTFSGFQVLDVNEPEDIYMDNELTEIELDAPFALRFLNVWNLGPTGFAGRLFHVELRDKNGVTKGVVSNNLDYFDVDVNEYYYWLWIQCEISSDLSVEPGDRLWLCAQDTNGEFLPVFVIDEQQSSVALDDYIPTLSSISTISDKNATVFPTYDLQGRRVSQGYKGIVIRGGKKMLQLR